MSWNIPVLKAPSDIPPLEFTRWFMGFVFCLITIVFGCLLVYYLTHDKVVLLYLFFLSIALLISFGIVAGWKILRTGMLRENNEIIIQSNNQIEEFLHSWSSEYISIIEHFFIIPPKIEIDKVIAGDEFSVIGDKSINFAPEVDYTSLFHELLSGLRNKLMDISGKGKLEINFSHNAEFTLPMWKSFTLAWKKLYLSEEALSHPVFMVRDYSVQIDEWLEFPGEKYRLIVVCNPLSSVFNGQLHSDAACVWLLAPSQITENIYPEKGRVYRAMNSDNGSIQSNLLHLLRYQDGAKEIKNLWFSKAHSKELMNQVIKLCNEEIRDPDALKKNFTELILGRQRANDIWITKSLAFIIKPREVHRDLIISQDERKTLLIQIEKHY